jgi:hypothetical protein
VTYLVLRNDTNEIKATSEDQEKIWDAALLYSWFFPVRIEKWERRAS